MIGGVPFDHSIGFGLGLASTNAMAVGGIKAGDNLIAVISWIPGTGVTVGHDVTDFTVAAGTITAGTIDLDGTDEKFVAIWTNAPAS